MRTQRSIVLIPALVAMAGAPYPAASQAPQAAPMPPQALPMPPQALPMPPQVVPAPPQAAPLSPLDAYAEAAATTILAEQNCPGTRLQAGRLTTLRLAAKVTPAQEGVLERKLRDRASRLRQDLATDGREAWCANALASFGPEGTIARGVLVR